MNSWSRTHNNPDIKALILAQPSTLDYLVSIIEPLGEHRIPHNYLEKTAEQAKSAADKLVQTHYQHNCLDSGCGEWQPRDQQI